MLKAISHSKAGRIQADSDSDTAISWRQLFRQREDLLTAAFFGRLRYLSKCMLPQVMTLLIGKPAAKELGALDEVDYWPRLRLPEPTGAQVEPDILLHFANALVVIEVKPPQGGQQTQEQWNRQLRGVNHAMELGQLETYDRLHFVALGRNKKSTTAAFEQQTPLPLQFSVQSHQREWQTLLTGLVQLQKIALGPDLAVLQDWQEALELYGLWHVAQPKFSELQSWIQAQQLLNHQRKALDKTSTTSVTDSAKPKPLTWSTLQQWAEAKNCLQLLSAQQNNKP